MSATSDPLLTDSPHADNSVMGRYQSIVRRRLLLMLVLVMAIIASLIIDFIMGPSGLSLHTLWQTLFDSASADAGDLVMVWDIRVPDGWMSNAVGMVPASADAEMQTILNNPLASPFTLGVSSA